MSKLVKRWESKMLVWYKEEEISYVYTDTHAAVKVLDLINNEWVKYPFVAPTITFWKEELDQLYSLRVVDYWVLRAYIDNKIEYTLWARGDCLKELINKYRYGLKIGKEI